MPALRQPREPRDRRSMLPTCFVFLSGEVMPGKCHTAYARKPLIPQEIYSSQIGICPGRNLVVFYFNRLTSIASQAHDSMRDVGIQSSLPSTKDAAGGDAAISAKSGHTSSTFPCF